jgi:hypothetical protein
MWQKSASIVPEKLVSPRKQGTFFPADVPARTHSGI